MELRKQLFLAKLRPYKKNLEKASDKDKGYYVTITLGKQYHSLLAEARELFPELAPHFPPELTLAHGEVCYCEKYLELEIFVDQIIELIGVET